MCNFTVMDLKKDKIVIYQSNDGQTNIDVRIEDESVWITQNQMRELFQSSKANISEHISHVFDEGFYKLINYYLP